MKPVIPRVGMGYDVHQLVEGRELWLGGIKLEAAKGALGHSDADVLLHALCDALLGAASLRDIGYHFSNKDPQYSGIDSKILLSKVMVLLKQHGYAVGNVDCMLILERPKINPHIEAMVATIAPILEVEPDCVSIKATTAEKMGFVGREEGIQAYATALIYKA